MPETRYSPAAPAKATTLVLLLTGLLSVSSPAENTVSLESISPKFPTSARIIWQVPAHQLPKSLAIYTSVPTVFPLPVLSNAIRLASFPMPRKLVASTNMLRISDNDTGFSVRSLDVLPQYGQLGYQNRAAPSNPTNVPGTAEVTQLAWQYATMLGLNPAELLEKPQSRRTRNCEYGAFTNQLPVPAAHS